MTDAEGPAAGRGRRRAIVPTRWRRVAVVATVALVASGVVPLAASAQSDDDAAQKAAQEIQEARNRANAAAEAFFQAESDLDHLQEDLIALEIEEAVLSDAVDRLRGEVEAVAVSRFMASGTAGIPLLTEVSAPQDQVQANVFVDVLTNSGADTIDEFNAAEKALQEAQDDVSAQRRDIENQKELFAQLEKDAIAEVDRLRKIEEERLQDEAVQRALEAQAAAERAEIEEELRREAEAAARAQPNPGLDIPIPTTTTTTVAPDGVAAADGAAAADDDTDGDSPTGTDVAGDTTPDTTSPVSTLPEESGASGGTSGGRTGVSGGGSSPIGINTGAGYLDNIACPILGSGYADTWGAPRSGGRRHQGVDMIAPSGVPLYAVTSGVVTFKQNRLGGNAVSLVGDNGNRYYYAHLSAYEGASGRRVVAGEVIGYNGSTGNSSTPHLHLQIHPGGGQPVNPYPTMRAMGC